VSEADRSQFEVRNLVPWVRTDLKNRIPKDRVTGTFLGFFKPVVLCGLS
jgi:hypothetical protein